MATVKAFRAVRPKKGMEGRIAALPYDVYNRQEACEVVRLNPDSFLAIDRAETSFPDDVSTYDDRVYEKARQLYEKKKADGDFIQDEKPCFYLYELVMDGHKQTGIVGCASVDDYLNGVIKKHENTREEKERDRIRHVDSLSAQTGPIFLAHRRNEVLEAIKESVREGSDPVYDIVSDDGIAHRVWIVEDESINESIAALYKGMDAIYIADGHHRCASAVKVSQKRRQQNPDFTGDEEFNYFLSVLFSEDELRIFDYNRVVKDLNGLDIGEYFDKLGASFDVTEYREGSFRPAVKGTFGMYLDGKWYKLAIHGDKKSPDPVKGLDVSLLQDNLLGPVLGIGDPRTDDRIDFIGGIRGLGEIERRCTQDCRVGFSMYPTSMTELFGVADAGCLMPPKSTWFEPKLRSGLLIHEI